MMSSGINRIGIFMYSYLSRGVSRYMFFDVGTTKFGTRCADDAIPHYLGRYHVGRTCGELVGVVDEVATNGNAHTVRIVFCGR